MFLQSGCGDWYTKISIYQDYFCTNNQRKISKGFVNAANNWRADKIWTSWLFFLPTLISSSGLLSIQSWSKWWEHKNKRKYVNSGRISSKTDQP